MKIINIKNKIHRAKRGYSNSDVWNMFDWFLEVMPPMLTKLRDEGCGVPNDLYVEGAENEREKWEAVLTEMIECLHNMDENKIRKQLGTDNGFGFKSLTREDYIKMHELMEKNKSRFFELFNKHFYDLWD
jgi:hypothetical protein